MAKIKKLAKPGSISSRLSWIFRQCYYRVRLKKICKVLDITPYEWQKKYVLQDSVTCMPVGRCNGKTMAVTLRILVRGPSKHPVFPARDLAQDPDACRGRHMLDCTYMEYRRYYEKCNAAGLMRWQNPLPRPRSLADIGILDEIHEYGRRV